MLTPGRLEALSRRDIPRIARRFSAGYDAQRARVPKGRLKFNPTNQDMHPFGHAANLAGFHPVLLGDATDEGPEAFSPRRRDQGAAFLSAENAMEPGAGV
jgi:hypothetical protein